MTRPTPSPPLYSIKEVAEKLGISPRTAHDFARKHLTPRSAYTLGRSWAISERTLAYLQDLRTSDAPTLTPEPTPPLHSANAAAAHLGINPNTFRALLNDTLAPDDQYKVGGVWALTEATVAHLGEVYAARPDPGNPHFQDVDYQRARARKQWRSD